MIATRFKQHMDSDVIRLPDPEPFMGKDVEVIVLEDAPMKSQVEGNPRKRIFGSAKDEIRISPDFDKPLP